MSFIKRERHKEIVSDTNIEKEYKSLNKQELVIVKYLKENGEVRGTEVEKLLGVSERRANYLLKFLLEEAVIVRLGTNKDIKYRLK